MARSLRRRARLGSCPSAAHPSSADAFGCPQQPMALELGSRLGHYEVTALIGEGSPASVRNRAVRELWRGLAEAKTRTRQ